MSLSARIKEIALAAGLGAVAALGFATAAQSAPLGDHVQVLNAVQRAGINVWINPSTCEDGRGQSKTVAGWYSAREKSLVVCQDNRDQKNPRHVVEYTQNDLDTIRHEAHHLVQDCLDGRIDGRLDPLFDTEKEFTTFVGRHLTDKQVGEIGHAYESTGHSPKAVVMEIEAFAVADGVSPRHIAAGIDEICNAK